MSMKTVLDRRALKYGCSTRCSSSCSVIGVRGAALATVISQAVSAVWVMTFLTGKKTRCALSAREPARGREDRVCRVLALGLSPFVMQIDGEPHRHLLQLIAPALRRRHGRRRDDGADEHHAVFEHAASGLDTGRAAHRELQLRRKERPARARRLFLPAARVLYLFNGHLASGRALPARVHPDFHIMTPRWSNTRRGPCASTWRCSGIFGIQIACQQTLCGARATRRRRSSSPCWRKVILLIPLIYILPHFFADKAFAVFLAEPVADFGAVALTSFTFYRQFRRSMRELEGAEATGER